MWDQYIPAGYTNFVETTDLAVSASSNPGSKFQTKYASSYSGQGGASSYPGGGASGYSGGGEPAAPAAHGKHTAPTPMWQKYTSGGGDHPGGPVAAYDTENLNAGISSSGPPPRIPAPAPATAPLPPPSQPVQPVQPVQPAWRYPSNPWEDRFNGQAPPPVVPVITTQEDEEVDEEDEEDDTTELIETQTLPVSPWSKYSQQGGSKKGNKGGNPWDKYMSQGGQGGSNIPVSAFDVTELAAASSSKKADKELKSVEKDRPVHNHYAAPPKQPKNSDRTPVPEYKSSSHDTKHRHPEPEEIEPAPKRSAATPSIVQAPHLHETPHKHATPRAEPVSHRPVYHTDASPASRPIGSGPSTPWYQGPFNTPTTPTPATTNIWGPYRATSGSGTTSRGAVATTVAVDAEELNDELATTSLSSVHHASHKSLTKSHHAHSSSAPTREEKTELNRCYQVKCNAQVGQAGAGRSDALTCLSKANGKQEAADCLGPEDSKSPSNALRTCMICHKCIEGKLKNPSVCAKPDPSWNNRGASWMP